MLYIAWACLRNDFNNFLSGPPQCGGDENRALGIITAPVDVEIRDVFVYCLWTISRGVIEITIDYVKLIFDNSEGPAGCRNGKIEVQYNLMKCHPFH